MYKLELERGAFYRVRRGQTVADIENTLCIPINGEVFEGMVLPIPQCSFTRYKAQVGDTYGTIAVRYGMEAEELKRINGGKPVYPTCNIFIPCK